LIARFSEATKNRKDIEIVKLETKYPQGGEKQLVYAVTGKTIPTGKLPAQVGAIVMNAGTVYAVYEAVYKDKPLYKRVVTVTGDAMFSTANYMVRIGTSFDYIIEKCGGFKSEPAKIIMGGPMMGIAQYRTDVPTVKTTSGILALSSKRVIIEPNPKCIRCGKCVDVCPMNLLPCNLSIYARKQNLKSCKSSM
jgi:electron transport complex protein RnfC